MLTTVALLAGMKVGGSGVDLVGLYTLALLLNLAAVLWAAGVAMRFRTMQAGPVMQFPVFVRAVLRAGLRAARRCCSGWIHGVATFNPLTRVLESGPRLPRGRADRGRARVRRGAALGALLFSLWALRGLRSAERAG